MAERKTRRREAEQAEQGAVESTVEVVGEQSAGAAEASQAAPLEAPAVKPPPSPTTSVIMAPNAVAPHVVDHTGVRLFDERGGEISVDDIFDYPTAERPGTMATVNKRVYQEFMSPNSSTPGRRLLYPQGAQVPIWEAERVKAEFKAERGAPVL